MSDKLLNFEKQYRIMKKEKVALAILFAFSLVISLYCIIQANGYFIPVLILINQASIIVLYKSMEIGEEMKAIEEGKKIILKLKQQITEPKVVNAPQS